MTAYPIQVSMTRGELGPHLHARVDLEYYKTGLKTCTNFVVLRAGGLRKREGFLFQKVVKNSAQRVRLLPFKFSSEQVYALEFGDNHARKYTSDGLVTTLGGTPSAITKANPGQVTITSHGLTTGDKVFVTGIGGMIELNNREFEATVLNANNFTIGIDTTSYGTFTSGGTIKKIVETVTPYSFGQTGDIDYAQVKDTMTLVHPTKRPRELARSSDTDWSISTITFRDGPYLKEPLRNTNGCTPDIRGVLTTGGSVTTDTLASGTGADLFDGDEETRAVRNDESWTVEYDLGGSVTRVCNNYCLQSAKPDSQPTAWSFEGYSGGSWTALDRRSGQLGTAGEKRFYEFQNDRAFAKYRFVFTANGGRESTSPADTALFSLNEITLGYNGDYAPTMRLSFDNKTNINDGAGFTANDDNRVIRIYGSDGKWRWFVITDVVDDETVDGRMYGFALPDTSKIFRWQLGAWKEDQWPSKVTFYESRRGFANSGEEPSTFWLSKTFDFYDMGISQPLVSDDGMRLELVSEPIEWMAELERLALGTGENVRILGKANANAGFGADNFDALPSVFTRASGIKPPRVGPVLLFADYYGKKIHELVYDLQQDGYIAPNVSILSEHLLKSGIVEMAFAETPDSVVWIATEAGHLVAMTYEREQQIVGLTRIEIAGGDTGTSAIVESVCCVPGAVEDEVWIAVKRTIGGQTVRTVEKKAPSFDYERGDLVSEAVYLDSALVYSGSATGTVNGAWHFIGLTVTALADGIVYRNLTVSSAGTVTLPNEATASKWVIGLAYTATGRTLALNEYGQRDGSGLGRRKKVQATSVHVFETLSLKLKGVSSADTDNAIIRNPDIDPEDAAMIPRTGILKVRFDSSWGEDGEFLFLSDDPLPCTVLAFTAQVTGEP